MIHDTPATRVFARTIVLAVALLAGCATPPAAPDIAALQQQVAATERAFARTMAERDHAAFTAFLAEDGDLRIRTAARQGRGCRRVEALLRSAGGAVFVASGQVEVLGGTLALSTGPVYDPGGRQVATFTSIWRQEAPGVWRIVFDKGNDVCDCAAPR